jgi:hypothetical protein
MSQGIKPQIRDRFELMAAAALGDIVLAIYPETVNRAATAAAWSRKVTVNLETATGEVHKWFNGSKATIASVGDTSTAGTATLDSTTIKFVDGVATFTVSGDAAAWLAAETDTLTIANMTIYGETVTGGTSVQTFV